MTRAPERGPEVRPLVAAAVAVALLVGFFRLSHPGLWIDEIYTARWTALPLPALLDALRADLHPPLYFVLERAVVGLLGNDEAGLRALSALAMAGTVALSFWAFRPQLGDRVAAGAAWMLVLSPQFVLYGRMARYYAFAALVATLTHGVLARLMAGRWGRWVWPAYGVALAAVLHTSYLAGALAVGHAWWCARRGRLRAWLGAAALAAALFAPWAASVPGQVAEAAARPAAVVSGPASWVLGLAYTVYGITASELLFPWSMLGALGAAAGAWLLVNGVRAALRRGLGPSLLGSSAASFLAAWVLAAALAPATPFTSLPARTLFLAPFGAALLALGMLDPVRSRAPRALLALGLFGAWLGGWSSFAQARDWMNPVYLTPGREVAQALVRESRAGDLVLGEDDTGVPWYLERMGWHGALVDPVDAAATARALADPVAPPDRAVWWARLSRDGSARLRPTGAARAALERWGRMDSAHGFGPVDPVYRQVRRRLGGLEPHAWRITLERWSRDPAPAPP